MPNNIEPTNIGQIRAKAAWKFAEGKNDTYASYVKKFPMYIKTNGLVNAVAFAYSKRGKPDKPKNEWEQLYDNLQSYFKDNPIISNLQKLNFQKDDGSERNLIQALIDADENALRMATSETFALFTWLKRFVKDETSNS